MIIRAAIVLLLILNLGVAAWWWLHREPATEAVPTAVAPRLQLLAEAATVNATTAAAAPVRNAQAATPMPPASAPATCAGPDAGADGWRVVLPPLANADAAQAMAARIRAAGFSDYLVMGDGADANAIALGRYGTREAAQRRVDALQAAGFPVRCARIPA